MTPAKKFDKMKLVLSEKINRIQTSQTIQIADITRELIANGRKIISLNQGEPDFETPEHIKKAAIKAIKDGNTKYSYVDGMPLLKEAISKKFLSILCSFSCAFIIISSSPS